MIVNVSISNGKFNGSVLLPYTHANYDGTRVWADEINPLLVFSVSTSASEVIFSGASSGEDGTLLVNLPITVKGGTGAPKLVLQRLRIMSNADAPAVLVTDEADLSVRDCYFMENPASAIRQISGRLEVRSSIFYGNGAADTSGGALQLLGGVSEILSSTLEANAGLYGAAVYVFDAVVSLGERTLLTNNFASKAGNSVSIANGTFNYLLPAPLGRWVGPVHQDGYRTNTSWLNYGYTSARDGYGTTTHAIHVFDDRAKTSYWDPGFPLAPFPPRVIELTQLAHIEEDFPYACEAGYYRSNDHADFQDGPQCEAICPAGYYCPLGTPHPIACFNASYCPTGSAWPIACPAGTYTQNNSLTNVTECSPCPAGYYCGLNTTFPVPCAKGHIAPTEGYSECEPCPVGYYAEELAQTQCLACLEGLYCSVGTTIKPCDPGYFRNLTDSSCVPAPIGHFGAKGATEPTECAPGTYANGTGFPVCPPCPAGTYEGNARAAMCLPCPLGGFCPEGAAGATQCAPGTIRISLGAKSQADCEPSFAGTYSEGGLPVDCPRDYYAPQPGGKAAGDCTKCQTNAITLATGQTNQSSCICQNGFLPLVGASGLLECVCGPGDGITAANDGCAPCALKEYKPFRGNEPCLKCDGSLNSLIGGWTTKSTGSTSHTDCVCDAGYYQAKTIQDGYCDEEPGQIEKWAEY